MTDIELRSLVQEVIDITAMPNNLRRVASLGSALAERGWYKRATVALQQPGEKVMESREEEIAHIIREMLWRSPGNRMPDYNEIARAVLQLRDDEIERLRSALEGKERESAERRAVALKYHDDWWDAANKVIALEAQLSTVREQALEEIKKVAEKRKDVAEYLGPERPPENRSYAMGVYAASVFIIDEIDARLHRSLSPAPLSERGLGEAKAKAFDAIEPIPEPSDDTGGNR